MVEYLGLHPRYVDSTETGGSSYLVHVGDAAAAIEAGRREIALATMAGARTRAEAPMAKPTGSPESSFETLWGMLPVTAYALAAQRHMFEFGTTSAQLAEVKVAASLHAEHNPQALSPTPVTVEEVLDSPSSAHLSTALIVASLRMGAAQRRLSARKSPVISTGGR